MTVKIITQETFQRHGHFDLGNVSNTELSDSEPALTYRGLRVDPASTIIAHVAEVTKTDPRRIRIWQMVKRQNTTIRPDTPVMDTSVSLLELQQRSNPQPSYRDVPLKLWAEVAEEVDADGNAIWPTPAPITTNGVVLRNDLILLFLKQFDAEKQTLRGICHVYLHKDKKVEEVTAFIMKKMGWGDKLPSDERLVLWEEIKPQMIEVLKEKTTLKAAELQDGDIICFQRIHQRKPSLLDKKLSFGDKDKSAEEGTKKSDKFEDAREYYDFLVFKQDITLLPHPTKCDPEKYPRFELTISRRITYEQLSEKVGARLDVPPTYLRFFAVHNQSGMPKAPLKRNGTQQLLTILNPSNTYSSMQANARNDAFYFEVLDIPLAELDNKKAIRVSWISEGVTKEEVVDLLVPKNGNIDDLVDALIKKLKLKSEEEAGRIRVMEVSYSRISREFRREYPVISLNEYADVLCERVPEEERQLEAGGEAQADGDDDGKAERVPFELVPCYHFHNEPARAHGVPFFFALKKVKRHHAPQGVIGFSRRNAYS